MNWLDIAIIAIIALATIQGRGQGALRAFVPLVGVIVATFVAGAVYKHLALNISTIVTDDYDAIVTAFLAAFFAIYLGAELLSTIMSPFVALLLLAPWVRTAGMLLGALRGFLLVNALLIFFVTYPSLGMEGAITGSRLASVFIDSFPVMRYLLPPEFDAAVAAYTP